LTKVTLPLLHHLWFESQSEPLCKTAKTVELGSDDIPGREDLRDGNRLADRLKSLTPVEPVPTSHFLTMERKAVIKNADMSEDMQQDAVDCASQALEKYNIEKDIAAYIKKEFDKKYNPTWHCIVGRNFGSYVTHETKHFIYFYLGQVAILLFKSG
jgi:dynein light chain LC8-type